MNISLDIDADSKKKFPQIFGYQLVQILYRLNNEAFFLYFLNN